MSRVDVTRWSTLAAVVSGALLVAGAIGEFLPGTATILFGTFFFVAHILFVFAVTGAYAHQVEPMGGLGLAGYAISMVGNVLFAANTAVEVYALPALEDVGGAFDALADSPGAALVPLSVLILAAGLLLFALALQWAGRLPAWTGWAMFLGPALLFVVQAAGLSSIVGGFAAPALLGSGLIGIGIGVRRDLKPSESVQTGLN